MLEPAHASPQQKGASGKIEVCPVSESYTQVQCSRHECLYHSTDPAKPGNVLCRHRDKPNYLKAFPCPLYRLNWGKNTDLSQEYTKYLKR